MKEFLRQCRAYFIYVAFFSFFINLLMLTLPIYMLQVFDRVITSRSTSTLVVLTIGALFCFLMYTLLENVRKRLLLAAGVALDGLAGPPVLTGVLRAGAKPGTNTYVGGLRDVAVVRSFLTGQGINALFDSPWFPIFLTVIYLFHVVLGIVATLGAVAMFVLTLINEKMTRPALEEMQTQMRRASRYIDDSVRNAEVAAALGMQEDLVQRWAKINDQVIDKHAEADLRSGLIGGFTRYVRLTLQIVMLGTGAYLVIQQHVSPGIMIAGTLLLARALAPIESAVHTWKGFIEARESYGRLKELLAQSSTDVQRTELPRPKGRLDAERVTFGIQGADRLIIKGVSFVLNPGETMGLMGPSAAGKTTLARLIIGVWRPANGSIRLDNADVSTWPRDHLGKFVGYVPQDVELFAGTVGENIGRLRPDASSEDIVEAARRAHVHDMVARLPKAYDTDIGPGGAQLSAGQRQRIALARALFGRPQLVVLDEPNANLDAEGEAALVQCLRELKQDGVTVIVVTHRPPLLAHADKMLVMRDGQVELFGPRADVVAKLNPRGGAEPGPVAVIGRNP